MSRRYVVIGAGGVGAALAAGLTEASIPVVLVSRGRTFDAVAREGLRFTHEGRTRTLDVPIVGSPSDLELRSSDVLVLAVKSQDAAEALAAWARHPVADGGIAATELPVVTLQNGLDAERTALRHFDTVLGGAALIAAQHVVAGEVTVRNGPKLGQIILGPFPSAALAADAASLVPDVAADLRRGGWLVHETNDPRRWKAWKAVTAATFPVEVLSGTPEELDEVRQRIRDEARHVLGAAGYEFADYAEVSYDPTLAQVRKDPSDGPAGLSTWQSFVRGSSSEADFLTGEIVLQARLLGLPSPVSSAVQRALAEAAAAGEKPGVRSARSLLESLVEPSGVPA
ncbi:MAG: 2-dehydropantoate 2-reductase N-terminal domain-containing protein [Microbacterium sp.]